MLPPSEPSSLVLRGVITEAEWDDHFQPTGLCLESDTEARYPILMEEIAAELLTLKGQLLRVRGNLIPSRDGDRLRITQYEVLDPEPDFGHNSR